VGISDVAYNVQFRAKMCIVIRLLPIVFSFANYRLQAHVANWTLRPRVWRFEAVKNAFGNYVLRRMLHISRLAPRSVSAFARNNNIPDSTFRL
jgi:hypothetical protein